MSLFLIVYNRATGEVDVRAEFRHGQAAEAVAARFVVERDIAGTSDAADVEVVVLSGDSILDLQRTHARYFQSVQGLLSMPPSATATDFRSSS